jgi:aminoglycoside phosphotransferase (APT) family kinase protein
VHKVDITVDVVDCLVREQFPRWADLPVRSVALDGWDNRTFRLGDELSVRLPSHEVYVAQIDKEHRWLPVLGSQLPLPIPQPVAKGQPGCGFPRPWSIYRWLPGEPAAITGVEDLEALAEDLAAFLIALRRVPALGGPSAGPHSFNRGGRVSAWDDQTRAIIDRLGKAIDHDGALAVWEAAVATEWAGPDVWVHGDVTGSNFLMTDDRLSAMIDFGCSAVGDPACDLTPAWTMFEGLSRRRFVDAVGYDDDTWARARGWAMWKALIDIPDRPVNDPGRSGSRFGWRWTADEIVARVISDHRVST